MGIPCLTDRLTVDSEVHPNNISQMILFVPAENTAERPPPDSSILLSLLLIFHTFLLMQPLFFGFCTLHCDTNMYRKPTKCTRFQINVLIQFSVSSTCFEHHVFIIRKTICTCSFLWFVFHTFM